MNRWYALHCLELSVFSAARFCVTHMRRIVFVSLLPGAWYKFTGFVFLFRFYFKKRFILLEGESCDEVKLFVRKCIDLLFIRKTRFSTCTSNLEDQSHRTVEGSLLDLILIELWCMHYLMHFNRHVMGVRFNTEFNR